LLVPRLEAEQARQLTGLKDVRDYIEWEDGGASGGVLESEWHALLTSTLRERGLGGRRLGVEGAALSSPRETGLKAALSDTDWMDISGWVESLRLIKTPEEVENHRQSAALASVGMDAALRGVRDRLSEREIWAAAAQAMLGEAARCFPDDPVAIGGNAIVGARTASLHLPATGTRPRPGDLAFVVLVASFRGSWCEFSRTVVVGGAASSQHQRMFEAVERAHATALKRAQVGVAALEVDRAARQALAQVGLGEYQPMRTGHGLGFSGGAEAPNLGAGDSTLLQPGMVISIEPSVCIPGVGGVCWADNYVLTDSGADPLTCYPVHSGHLQEGT
jgi:Xaa-Pro aminopeptidase